jgi:transcriptional regulator GlxA family with amidase domain
MTNGQSSVGRESDLSGNGTVSPFTLEELRVRVVARRRVEQREGAKRVANRSRREKLRTVAVCAGALLLMALGLYFGLAHQESAAPVEGAAPTGVVSPVGIA